MPDEFVYEERVVAFLDILGFSSLVRSSAENDYAFREISTLVDLLEGVVPGLDERVDALVPKHLIPRHMYVSDCIILSTPLFSEELPRFNGLEVMAMRVSQVTHRLLGNGYLLRGGIDLGRVWHGDSNIVGPAYLNAFGLEGETGLPRVVFSEGAAVKWRETVPAENYMSLDYQGVFMVNGLHDYYMPRAAEHGGIEATFDEYEALVQANVANEDLPERARNKWVWFADYLQFMKDRALPMIANC